ncbi:uncharacterized protein TRIADDRAFT_28297 [Trichoplax adhaerens]|uniref:Uncharacterized protein n=1 Tax=Trichoplax adhaerens TaxID=10228 RepID=B3S399_TRIAD|nr:hypothetical protein TRIADDRAFT_28297 [Trichoplax adhaerens]EDV22934.1 hypothetical protein TRIADDRAFT_28297 [Trichoplax adhaerens]|eukprot:XP_002114800.1 hypothetical protein TRIADDRAFT_28297 [Trichoplax adhaerens]
MQLSVCNVAIAIVAIGLLNYIWTVVQARTTLPSGPLPWPIVGNTFALSKLPELTLTEMRKRYGDVFTVFIGTRPCLIVNGVNKVKEALLKNSVTFGGRPNLMLFKFFEIPNGPVGISATDYTPTLRLHRKVTHTAIRNYTQASGSDAAKFEQLVRGEINKLIKVIEKHESKPFDVLPDLLNSVTFLIFTVCFGPDSFEKYIDRKSLEKLSAALTVFDEYISMNNIFDTFPFLYHLLMKIPSKTNRELEALTNDLLSMLEKELETHKETYDPDTVRDILDAMIKAKREAEDEERDDKASMLDDYSLIGTIGDLFFAGMQTTSYTVQWYLLFMITHPQIQKKVHDELDQIVGRNNYPAIENRSSLKFLDATISETLRLSSIVPLSLPHAPLKDIEIFGQKIPKGTAVWVNLWSVHHDEALWPNAKQFQPQRFLDKNGDLIKSPNLIPFSVGTRTCIGESLARYELFMYISHLMNHFEFKMAESQESYDLQPRPGLVHGCKSYKLIATPRK